METIELYAGVQEIVGLLSNEELSVLTDYVFGINEDTWFVKNSHGLFVEVDSPDVVVVLESYRNGLAAMFEGKTILPIERITRTPEGKKIYGHTDNVGNSRSIKGVILYLNDDFEGGELYYKDIDLTYKPRAGSVIIHNADYYHEVLPVTSGTRYSATTFVWE